MALVYIDIENGAGVKQGGGPITSASYWRYTARMDLAGAVEFEMPASDPKAALVQKKRVARAYAYLNGQRVEVGAGIIDHIENVPQDDGKVSLKVSGDDLVRELTYRSVLNLVLYFGGNAVSHAAAVAAVAAFAPPGWTMTPDGAPPNDSIYGYFNGESVLAAAIKITQKAQDHFYRGAGRTLIFASTFTPSGVRAIQARGDLSPATCAITRLTQQIDTYDLITRIYPRGSGNANAQLTLRATTRSAPAGFTLNTALNYIEYDAGVVTYGRIERQVDFRDIGPISNTDADIVAASNALFDAALETLKRQSSELEQATYTMEVAGCSQLLRPMQTILLTYRNSLANLTINANLNILETTWQVDSSGIFTTAMKVSNVDRWPVSDVGTIVNGIEAGQVYRALQQLNANSYVTNYTKNVDSDEVAQFRFRFGDEVTQLQQVLFEFQLLPFESTIKNVLGTTATSSAGGASTQSASSGGSHTHNVTIAAHSHTVTISAHTHTVTVAAHSHTVTIAAHTHSVTIAAHSHTVTVAAHTHTVSVAAHTHSVPDHDHQITVAGIGVTGLNPMRLDFTGGVGGPGFMYYDGTVDKKVNTNPDTGATTSASGGSQTPTSSSAGGQSPTSDAQGGQTPSSSSGGGQSPTSDAQGGQTPSSSSGGGQSPSSDTIAQTVPTSSSAGTHTHTVTVPSHTHTVLPVIQTTYGIFREAVIQTYVIGDLEYSINGGAWTTTAVAIDAGSGWWRIDITSVVMDATSFRPVQESNLLEIRAASTAGLITTVNAWTLSPGEITINTTSPHGLNIGDKVTISGATAGISLGTDVDGDYVVTVIDTATTFRAASPLSVTDVAPAGGTLSYTRTATIDAQLSVRSIIQAVAYS